MQMLIIGWFGALLTGVSTHGPRHGEGLVSVPFVGCGSDGQPGAQPPPEPQRTPTLPAALARRLAYYQARRGPGVLAPRGWHCWGLIGTSGVSLTVQPEMGAPLNRVEVMYGYGGTSGRVGVAQNIARYFPSYRHFNSKLIGDLPNVPIPHGPYPHDRICELTETYVRFTTPPRTTGQGTDSWGPSARPVHGFVMLVEADVLPDIAQLNMQLPDSDSALEDVILEEARISLRHGSSGWPLLQ